MTIKITDATKNPVNISSGATATPFSDISISNPVTVNQYGLFGGGGTLKIHLSSSSALTNLGSLSDPRDVPISFDPSTYTYSVTTLGGPQTPSYLYPDSILDRLTYTAPSVLGGTAADVKADISFTGNTADPTTGQPITQTVVDPNPITLHVAAAAIPDTVIGTGADNFTFAVSEDAFQGDAQVIFAVDGKQLGGVQTVTASHAAGASQNFVVNGDFGYGAHKLSATFLNDAWDGGDRNLFVDGIKFNGDTIPASSGALWSNGTATFEKPVTGNELKLTMAEDAWSGDAHATIYLDGHQIGSEFITAANSQGATQDLIFRGDYGSGPHQIGVQFNNDAWGGSDAADRNLFLKGATFDGNPIAGAQVNMWVGGVYTIHT
ncbi:MAG: hypothetical protein JWP57_4405 [Spirosoma sp.]|nr:hypothetical protein [Spirosoma sp.]